MGELVRVFYFHLPPAIICYLSLLVSVVTGLIYIRTKDFTYDPIVPRRQLPPIRDRIPDAPPTP